jgi:hypothetical protein
MLVGLYAWTVTLAFGATLIDVVDAGPIPSGPSAVPSEAGDLLLAISALAVLTGIGAVMGSWGSTLASYVLVASLAVAVVGLLTPTLVGGIISDAERALEVRIGPWVRVGEGGVASILAFVGLWESWRHG